MLEEIINERKQKLNKIVAGGHNPYPAVVKRTHTTAEVLKDFGKLSTSRKRISIVGRVMSLRDQGNIIFADVKDGSGKLQVILSKKETKGFADLKKTLDIGDFIEAGGGVLKTKKGEKSVQSASARIIVKAILPLPSEYYGVEDPETILRKRYLDLTLSDEIRDLFIKKSVFWQSFREFLIKENFLEVETPVLEATPGGAEAEPFKTHHNALDEDFYLRISLEITLKKLLVGGYERVFEIGRIFRNEGMDAEHLQDYTQLEFYWAYADYNELMKFVRKMYLHVIKQTFGNRPEWTKPWKKVSYCDAFKKENKLDPLTCSVDDLRKRARELGLKFEPYAEKGRLIDLIFKKTVRPKLTAPSFLIDPPVFVESLAKRSSKNPLIVERFQVMAYGTELGKGFSELNDPADQRARFEEQMKLREKGDTEAQRLDEEFIEALSYGMPPATGFGVSERLFSVIAGRPIRETVFFPPMKRRR
ncbi:lysine--tRNA ligase [Candidatus Wolfebacteria bacterium RIFCSPHIGHO2_01_FULL_48_22]|uniref:Lysine--tRNA ligase n=2 Tax=Candidatus Wolfeibacteriota TaxID=1752735 RepID=A0A1F8DSY0_9BACT|nr:MAG: lysine--tRNA ligase [Candidatus Wolfebacteria bacterium RIFCSPHIGHO2_01_FULL_48_22]OGM91969.1 MAG: lysine--tRNA ligase [Candidatus Wolfebacteria bacterium RIFCSPLOWO2_01_FULL_47_17b]